MQSLELQKDAVKSAGAEEILEEQTSGGKTKPQLEKLLDKLRSGDEVIVYRLDRLSRSLKELVYLVELLESKKITLVSLSEQIDTKTANGKLMLHLFGALAEFERNLLKERTQAGLLAARARGRFGGRPKIKPLKIQAAIQLWDKKEMSIRQITAITGISQGTLYKYLNARRKNS